MIVAGLIYYRPGEEELERLLRSLSGRVGALVALDGVYEGVRGPVSSRGSERELIDRVAAELELPCYNPAPPSFRWRSEPVKRTVLAHLAYEEFGGGGGGSLLVIDADEELLTPVPELEPGRLGVALIDDETPAMRRFCKHPRRCTSPDCGCELLMVRRLCPVPREECTNPYCECEPVLGATMIRHHHLTADLEWGPSHVEVAAGGIRYSTPHCLPTNPSDFTIRHHGQFVKQNREYQRYNDHERMRIEATGESGGDARREAFPTWGYQSRSDTIHGGISGAEERLRLPATGGDRVTPRRPS